MGMATMARHETPKHSKIMAQWLGGLLVVGVPWLVEFSCDRQHNLRTAFGAFLSIVVWTVLYVVLERWLSVSRAARYKQDEPKQSPKQFTDHG